MAASLLISEERENGICEGYYFSDLYSVSYEKPSSSVRCKFIIRSGRIFVCIVRSFVFLSKIISYLVPLSIKIKHITSMALFSDQFEYETVLENKHDVPLSAGLKPRDRRWSVSMGFLFVFFTSFA